MVEIAKDACLAGRRVWWIGLPAQRAGIFRRVTEGGFTALGLEVMSSQQAYYRLLAGPAFVELKPLVVGTARLVRVAEALAECAGSLPAPGEAKLFAAAIAEAKRFGLAPDDVASVAGSDVEIARLAEVFAAYQGAMTGRWDYDDVRAQALALVESPPFASFMADPGERARAGLPDLVIVDGLRELGPLDLRALLALGRQVETHLTLPELPSGISPDEADVVTIAPEPAAQRATVRSFLAPNPVAEARWTLRSLKRDLASGRDPLDLAVIAPPGTASAVLALADEYGVPLMDETPRALADEPQGGTLLDLLELAEVPTASRLLAVPELAPLAAEALRAGVAGADALGVLAHDLGLEESWRRWLRRLRVSGDPVAWTRDLLSEVLPLTHEVSPKFAERVLTLAQEAATLAAGPDFAVWLAALLRDARSNPHGPGGIALLDAKLASGRRFEKVYVLGALEGAYRAGEREDYFISEDLRGLGAAVGAPRSLEALDALLPLSTRLPRRFQGRSDDVAAELLSRGRETVVLAPAAGGGDQVTPDERLLGEDPQPLPPVEAGSVFELGGAAPYVPAFDAVSLDGAFGLNAESLRRYDQCAFRAWGERLLLGDTVSDESEDTGFEEWHQLVTALTARDRHTPDSLAELGRRFPDFSGWLEEHEDRLTSLVWGAELNHGASGMRVWVHAGSREQLGNSGRYKSVIYRFVAPAGETDWSWGSELQRHRWTEYLAAGALLAHRTQAPAYVEIVLWPLLGEPLRVDRSDNRFVSRRIERTGLEAKEALERLRAGDVSPTPGYHCRFCRVFEVCRVGRRS